jgi:hypothetical protein
MRDAGAFRIKSHSGNHRGFRNFASRDRPCTSTSRLSRGSVRLDARLTGRKPGKALI